MSVGSRIQKILDSKGLTPAELSRRSGVGQGRISLILNGKTPNPRGDTISKLAQALEVSVSSLLSEDKPDIIYANGTGHGTVNEHSQVLSSEERHLLEIFAIADPAAKKYAMLLLENSAQESRGKEGVGSDCVGRKSA
jgi:transcriptional regulator with XRE-family HTH domain